MGLVLVVSMMFPSRDPGPLLIGLKLRQGFPLEYIADSLDDHLLTDVQRGMAGLVHVCDSGSIKGCLMFVQKYFDLIGFLWQEMSQLCRAFDRRDMDRHRAVQLPQSEVDALEGFFNGSELHPSFPTYDPGRHFVPGALKDRVYEYGSIQCQ